MDYSKALRHLFENIKDSSKQNVFKNIITSNSEISRIVQTRMENLEINQEYSNTKNKSLLNKLNYTKFFNS